MAKRGPKEKYDANLHPALIQWLARRGLTDAEIAKHLKISEKLFHTWKHKHPEIVQPLKEGKDFVDDLVEGSLLKRALGFDFEESKVVIEPRTFVKDGGVVETRQVAIKTETVVKHVAPDVTAQIFWLKNRRPAEWRDKQEYEHTGKDGERLFGVMVAPQGISPEDWVKTAASQQAALLAKKGNGA